MKENILTYNKQIEEDFADSFKENCRSISIEGIHKMRVSVKKLKALISLLDFIDEKPKTKKNLKEIKKLYRSAGALRDIHMQSNIIESYKNTLKSDYNLYLKQLNEKKEKVTEKLHGSLNEFNIESFVKIRERIENKIKSIKKDQIFKGSSQLFQNRMGEIEKMTVALNDDSILHLIRRYLKQMIFLNEAIKGNNLFFSNDKEKMVLLTELEMKLGKWHDIKVFLDHFLLFKHKGDSYWDLLELIEEEKLTGQKEISGMIEEFIS